MLSVEDVDKVVKDGLGLRYAFMGPFETCHLNADGSSQELIYVTNPIIYLTFLSWQSIHSRRLATIQNLADDTLGVRKSPTLQLLWQTWSNHDIMILRRLTVKVPDINRGKTTSSNGQARRCCHCCPSRTRKADG